MSSEFVSYLHEVFAPLGVIRTRRMFGGYGIYHQDLMFAVLIDETLYLKADDSSRANFEALDLPPFRYERQGKFISMSYYQAPEAIFDDPDEARLWGRRAYDAALRSPAKKPRKRSATASHTPAS